MKFLYEAVMAAGHSWEALLVTALMEQKSVYFHQRSHLEDRVFPQQQQSGLILQT